MNPKRILIILAAAAFLSGTSAPGWATRIALGGPDPLGLAPIVTAAAVEGNSTDACILGDFDGDANGNGIASAGDSCAGVGGTISAATAFAKTAGLFPEFTSTFAFTHAGALEASDALAQAKAGALMTFAGVTGFMGSFDLAIDPFMTTEGDASARMSYVLTFKGDVLFSAEGILDHGLLTTSGAFSNSDFDVDVNGSRTIAKLVNTSFSVPFTVSAQELGQPLPFEFEQVFAVHSENGGLAVVDVPEPSAFFLLVSGACMLGFIMRRKQRHQI